MNKKLTLLAAVILTAIGSSAALAGREKMPASEKAAGMSCCAAGSKAPAPAAEKEVPAESKGLNCHRTAAAPKSCCK